MLKYNISNVSDMLYQAATDFNTKRDYRGWSAVIKIKGVDVFFLFDEDGTLVAIRSENGLGY
jgi:hypothetical protein